MNMIAKVLNMTFKRNVSCSVILKPEHWQSILLPVWTGICKESRIGLKIVNAYHH